MNGCCLTVSLDLLAKADTSPLSSQAVVYKASKLFYSCILKDYI